MTLLMFYVKRSLLGLGLLLFVLLTGSIVAQAQSVSQGYQSSQKLQKGMIVRLDPAGGSKVQSVTQQDDSEIFGVVVSSGDAAVSLSNTEAELETFVANAGQYEALVSDQNGSIMTGDYIAISSLAGIGMKANGKQQFVLGKALSDFNGKTHVVGTSTLQTSNGDRKVHIGRVRVEVLVAQNPHYKQDNAQPGVPQVLSNLVDTVTDKPIAAFRIYIALTVILIAIVVAGSILFAGVRTGMVAVGRNPLAKHSIARNLVRVMIMALIVFVIGLIAVYLLLKV